MLHERTPMQFAERLNRPTRFRIKGRPRQRNVWYYSYRCPLCGKYAERLMNLRKSQGTPHCDGT